MAGKVMVVVTGPRELCIAWITERKCGAVVFASLFTTNVRLVVCLQISFAGLQIFCGFVCQVISTPLSPSKDTMCFIFSNASFPSVAM